MKITFNKRGFTILEVLVATSISMLVVAGIVTCFMAGMRLWKFQYTKANVMNEAYIGMSKMLNDIRGAYWIQLGRFNGSTFTGLAEGVDQIAPAIKVMRSPSTNDWFIFYYSSASNTLFRAEYPGNVSNTVIVPFITSGDIFRNEIYTNTTTILSTHTNQEGLVSVTLQFGLPNTSSNLLYNILGTNIYQTRFSVCTRKI